MAFPTIQGADTKNGTQTSNSSSWTVTYPTNINAGNLIIAFFGTDGSMSAGGITATGFSSLALSDEGAASCVAIYKFADGTETGNFTASLAASEQGGWRIFRITGAHASTPPEGAGAATGSDSFPNPPNLDPANWGAEQTLWFAACGIDTSRTISNYPLANTTSADVSGGSTGATLGLCTSDSEVSSLNPGTFTSSASDQWAAITVGVRPAGAAATDLPPVLIVTSGAI